MPNKSEHLAPKPAPPHTRLPPPSLFQGPPSRNGSNISLPGALLPGAHASAVGLPSSSSHASHPQRPFPLRHSRSFRGTPLLHSDRQSPNDNDPSITLDPSTAGPRPPTISREPSFRRPRTADTEADRAEAIWAEMQSTLAEVELSAVNGTHVFGSDHAKALEELRTSQLALAQAWTRSEIDEGIEAQGQQQQAAGRPSQEGSGGGEALSATGKGLNRDNVAASPSTIGSVTANTTSPSKSLEEETESDMLLARRRREANDRYFSRVNEGVLDVVGRLEEVADMMRKVENESRSIWSESESSGFDSGGGTTMAGKRLRSGTVESKTSQRSAFSSSGAGG